MKTRTIITTKRSFALGLGCALAVTAFSGLQAQEWGTAKGGATKLMQFNRPGPRPGTPASEQSDFKAMSCEKCRDLVFEGPVAVFKGGAGILAGRPQTERIVQHRCEGCNTTLTVVGHGKAKTQVAKHTCTSCGSEVQACCSMGNRNPGPTKGMEK